MDMRKVYWASVFAVTLAGAASTAAASPAPTKRCVLGEYSALSVSPFRTDEDFGLGNYTVLKGAQFYVAAKPGLTAEWLTLSVQRELAKLQSGADQACRPNVRGVTVSVASSGGGFWVFLSAPDERSAASLLSWAKSIAPSERAVVQ
jgi:hypothetical protein